VETVLAALAPIAVTSLLGFVAAWHHDFAAKDAAVLNRMVLLYAVPVALFVGTPLRSAPSRMSGDTSATSSLPSIPANAPTISSTLDMLPSKCETL
jgi:predicted permease